MTAATYSPMWYRVSALKPQLSERARLHRHRYRERVWYLLHDPANGRVHRFSSAARLLLAAMNGQRSVADMWALAQRELGESAPTQDEVIQLLGQLHAADLLVTDVTPDAMEVFSRGAKQEAQKRRRSWANPMAVRIPLWDPGKLLDRHARLWPLIWGWPGMVLWLAVVMPALVMAGARWPELTGNLSDRVLEVNNLLLLGLVFPFIKFLHEMGHATATRADGGEVHDMGVMLLVMMPVPYVDASASTVFRSKWRRAMVGGAGMIVEVFLAALAFYVWASAEPGMVRSVAFNVMFVAGVSALIFNGNPLLRYDAYYILADLIESPNLAQQAARQWGYLLQRHVLRAPQATPVAYTWGEGLWLAFYGLASTIYRMLVTVAIALFVGTQFFFIGVVLALWAVVNMAVMPLVRLFGVVQQRSQLRELRWRIYGVVAALVAVLGLALTLVPVPHRTQAEGVVWLPEQATLRAGTHGFMASFLATPGEQVQVGQPLMRYRDPALDAQVALLQARLAELQAQHAAEFVNDRARAEMLREQITAETQVLERALQRQASLIVSSGSTGRFIVPRPEDLNGRFARQGEVLGFVSGELDRPFVRVIVTQAEVDTVGAPGGRVHLRLAHAKGEVFEGRIVRQQPAGKNELPSRVLTVAGGGAFTTDPRDPQGLKAMERLFQVDVEPASAGMPIAPYFGQRVHVRFDHPALPLGQQWYHSLRRLFLSHFDV